jgi:chorismate synthase
MSSFWTNMINVSLFGESHGPGIGVVIDGLPSGFQLDHQKISEMMSRRSPGRTAWSTPRREEDKIEILSGLYEGFTTGTPLTGLIRNHDTRSADYSELRIKPRPGHADLTGMVRYNGFNDPRGGGHFSGRLTAPLTFAGAVCKQMLSARGITTAARIYELGGISDLPVNYTEPDLEQLRRFGQSDLPTVSQTAAQAMQNAVLKAKTELDSVGGIVEGFIVGLPAGMGNPIFSGIESRLAGLLFSIPAVKGVEFGAGFQVARRNGSQNNDSPAYTEKGIRMLSNNSGGSDGGISNGMPIVFRVAFKPTASISRPQKTINLQTGKNDDLVIHGRHDPCIVPRAVPVVEAAAALFALDLILETEGRQTDFSQPEGGE